MTLGEARAVVAEWATAPPLVFLVESLVNGLAGAPVVREITDGDLVELNRRAGTALPIVRNDSGLPKSAPVFDLDALRRKNAARVAAAHLKERKSG